MWHNNSPGSIKIINLVAVGIIVREIWHGQGFTWSLHCDLDIWPSDLVLRRDTLLGHNTLSVNFYNKKSKFFKNYSKDMKILYIYVLLWPKYLT